LASFRAKLAGTPPAPAVAVLDSVAVRDSIEGARIAGLVRADSIQRADSIARVIARADSIVRADSIAQAAAARAAAARRTAANRPRTTPQTPPARPAVPTAGLGDAPPTTTPTAGNVTAPTGANAAKDGVVGTPPRQTETLPVAGAAPAPTRTEPPAPAAPTGPGTIRIGSRIPQAVLYLGDEVKPIGGRGLQTLTFPAGSVRISIKAENCVTWDTTFTVVAGQTHTIGYRPSRC
jgi:hypothetical protein